MEARGAQNPCPACGLPAGGKPESALHLPPGTILQDKFILGRALGQGGFGITYLAWDKTLKLKLAIKEYLPQQLAYRTDSSIKVSVYKQSLVTEFDYGREKFLEEAQTLARFNEHPNIVTVRDFFTANGTAYLVMNYHEGVTLQSYLDSKGGKISVEQALTIFMPVLDALKEVHAAGILHRDISPDNLLIDKNGRVILIDFGAARQAMGEKSKSLSVIMKAGYSPPEQYQSRGKQGPWTDIYAVAATVYRAITGQAPLEAIDRMAEDDLQLPSQLGVKIDKPLEETMLKALAISAKERYKAVEDFQAELDAASKISQPVESYTVVKTEKPGEPVKEKIEDSEESIKEKAKEGFQTEATKALEKELGVAEQHAVWAPKGNPSYAVSKKVFKTAALAILCGLFIFGVVSLFGGGEEAADPAGIAGLDVDYYIDYENGNIPLKDLPMGARVVDPGWEWEYRTGRDYTLEAGDETKPVTWLVVAKDHYDGLDPHVTLLTKELIGRHAFDNSTHVHNRVYNHWGESGTHSSADRGLRPWLNSNGIHSGEGFYRAFSESFTQAVLTTTVTNSERRNNSAYSTSDQVFIPSTTELGDTVHSRTYPIGKGYAYFSGADDAKRIAQLGGEDRWYWTRSPDWYYGLDRRVIDSAGEFYGTDDSIDSLGVRPALNLKSDTLVSEIRK